MAENYTPLENVKLGDTQVEFVEKIKNAIVQINQNMDDIENAGKVDEIQVNGANAVANKKVNLKNGTNISISKNTTGDITISSTAPDTKNTAGAKQSDYPLWLIGVAPKNGDYSQNVNPDADYATTGSGNVFMSDGTLFVYNEGDRQQVLDESHLAVINEKLGNLAGGMRFRGTVGTGGTVTALPSTAENGDTYKVKTKGTYANQSADVGDLFIAVKTGSTLTWDLVPSGDDGDVYTNTSWSSPNQIIVSGGSSGTTNKEVKASNVTINTTAMSGNATDVPASNVVKSYVDNAVIAVEITLNDADGWGETQQSGTTAVDGDKIYTYTGKPNYNPICVYNSNGEQLMVGLWVDGVNTVIRTNLATDIQGGTLIMMRQVARVK